MKRPIHAPWPKTASLPLLIALALAPTAFVHAEPFAYITNQGSHDVSVIDLATQKVMATLPVGRSPAGVVASSRAGRVFVSNPDSKTISVIDMHTQKVVDTLVAGDGPVGIDVAPDGSYVYAADWYRDRLLVLDVRARALDANHPEPGHQAPIASIKVGKAPYGAALSADGMLLYVTNQHDDTVSVLDARSGLALGSIATGKNSRGFGAFIGASAVP